MFHFVLTIWYLQVMGRVSCALTALGMSFGVLLNVGKHIYNKV